MRIKYLFISFFLNQKVLTTIFLMVLLSSLSQLKAQESKNLEFLKRKVEIISNKIEEIEKEFNKASINIDKVEKEIESYPDEPAPKEKKELSFNKTFSNIESEDSSPLRAIDLEINKIKRLQKTFQDIQEGVNNLYNIQNNSPRTISQGYKFKDTTSISDKNKKQVRSQEENNTIKQNPRKTGTYYIAFRPSIHVANNLDYNFIHGPKGEIETEGGYGISLDLGKKIGNGEFGFSLGINNTNYSELNWLNRTYQANGESNVYQFLFSSSYRFQLSEDISLRTGGALGFAKRHDHYNISLLSPNTLNENSLILTGQLSFDFAYRILDQYLLTLGYRFSYLGESGHFGEMYLNAFELGLAWDL